MNWPPSILYWSGSSEALLAGKNRSSRRPSVARQFARCTGGMRTERPDHKQIREQIREQSR
jgi:hypothetical protein